LDVRKSFQYTSAFTFSYASLVEGATDLKIIACTIGFTLSITIKSVTMKVRNHICINSFLGINLVKLIKANKKILSCIIERISISARDEVIKDISKITYSRMFVIK
jgi:hypothetical protein